MIETSEALARDIRIKMHPWFTTLESSKNLLSPVAHPRFRETVEINARLIVANILSEHIQSGQLHRMCAGADVAAWATDKASRINLHIGPGRDPMSVGTIQLENIQRMAEEVLEPYLFEKTRRDLLGTEERGIADWTGRSPNPRRRPRTETSPYIQNVMRNVQRGDSDSSDSFALDMAARALLNALDPGPRTHANRRAIMEEQLRESLRQEREAETKAKEQKEAVASTGFGRVLDLD